MQQRLKQSYHLNPFLLILFISIFSLHSQITISAHAQSGPWRGWCTVIRAGGQACYPDPMSACYRQWQEYSDPRNAFEGYYPFGSTYHCDWVTFSEGGYGGPLPTIITNSCDFGYRAVLPGLCVPNNQPRREREMCRNDGGGSPNPTGGTNPILLSTGTKFHEEQDYVAADGRFDLRRFYRSSSSSEVAVYQAERRALGTSWRTSYEYSLHIEPTSFDIRPVVTVYMPDGSPYDFRRQSDGTMRPEGSFALQTPMVLEFVGTWPTDLRTLTNNPTQWRLTISNNQVITFLAFQAEDSIRYSVAKPTTIVDSNGYTLTYAYDSLNALSTITDSYGEILRFTWIVRDARTYGGSRATPAAIAVERIDLPDRTAIRYRYDNAASISLPFSFPDRLVGVEFLDQNNASVGTKRYLYENLQAPHLLTGVIDESGVRVATWRYDSLGRAISSEGANGLNRYDVNYQDTRNSALRTVVNPLNKTTVYTFDRSGDSLRLRSVVGEPSANCLGSAKSFEYNTQGFLSAMVDANNNRSTYTYDTRGRLIESRRAVGSSVENITSATWHPSWWLPTTITTSALQIAFTYNSLGQLISRQEQDRATLATRAWNYSYQAGGKIIAIDGPLSGSQDTTTFGYSNNGFLTLITDSLGHTIQRPIITGRGLPTRIVDSNNVTTDLSYDARGRLMQVVLDRAGIAASWNLQRTPSGDLSAIIDPVGRFLRMDRDNARRLTALFDNAGNAMRFSYDALGNITTHVIEDPAGQLRASSRQVYDELGRIIKWIGGSEKSWGLKYDREGNVTSITNPSGGVNSFVYDELQRIASITDEEGSTTSLVRTLEDAVSLVIDPRQVRTLYSRNGWQEIIGEQSSDTGTTTLTRNPLGLITNKLDGRGVLSTSSYDSEGRILSQQFPSQLSDSINYSYDDVSNGNKGKGRLTGVQDPSGSIHYFYDALGSLVKETKTIGAINAQVEYAYDASARLIGMRYPSGRVIIFVRNPNGEVSAVQSNTMLVHNIRWAPFGPIERLTYGNGISEIRGYDSDYRLQKLRVGTTTQQLLDLAYFYRDGMNITNIQDNLAGGRTEKFLYSPTGRLVHASGTWGSTTLTYDASGNRLSQKLTKQDRTVTSEIYNTAPFTNRLLNIAGTTPRSFNYDGGGYTIGDLRSGITKTYNYNSAGQLSLATINNTSSPTSYIYNAFGQLVSRSQAAVTAHYIYDQSGHVIAELDGSGATVREYVWLDDRPIAMYQVGSAGVSLFYIHTDYMDRPVVLTNSSAVEVWRVIYQPWGDVQQVTETVPFDLRLPGQWLQRESGLHYNWHRHYDPTLGRYIQPDPIGLIGGLNRYSYAAENPLSYIDPNGTSLWRLLGFGLSLAAAIAADIEVQVHDRWELYDLGRMLNMPIPRESRQPSQCTPDNPFGRPPPPQAYAQDDQNWPEPPEGETEEGQDGPKEVVRRGNRNMRPPSIPPWLEKNKGERNKYLRNGRR